MSRYIAIFCGFLLFNQGSNATVGDDTHQVLSAIGEGEWVKLNTNLFSNVWTPSNQRPRNVQGIIGSPDRVIKAWSSMAWDKKRETLIFWGGGHANYAGNEVYLWKAADRRWVRGSLPSEVSLISSTNALYEAIDGVDMAPIASHTYDNNEYLPLSDRFIVFGGAAYNTGWRFEKNFPSRTSTGPYWWDPAKADANSVGGSMGSHVNPNVFPNISGGYMWENRDNMPSFNLLDGVTAYSEEQGKDVIYLQSAVNGLWKYTVNDVLDSTLDTYAKVGINWDFGSGQGAGAYDKYRKIFLRTGNDAFTLWDLNQAGSNNKSVKPTIFYTDTGIGWLGGYGMDFDPLRKRFVLWNGYKTLWYVKSVASSSITLSKLPDTNSTEFPNYGPGTGVLGKWKYVPEYDIYIGVTDPTTGDVWAYKPENWIFNGPTIINNSVADTLINGSYHQIIQAIGFGQLNWQLVSGQLPVGLSLNQSTGEISGTPTIEGQYAFSIKITDENNLEKVENFTLRVDGPTSPGTQLFEQFSDSQTLSNSWQAVDDGTLDAPSAWVVQNGTLVQKSNVYSLPTDAVSIEKRGGYLLYRHGAQWTDYDVKFSMRADDDDAMGVMFRYIDKDNYYRFSWDMSRTYRRLVKVKNGVFTVLGEDHVPFVQGRNYQGKIVAIENQLEVWIDGQRVLVANDADHPSGTIGFYTWGNVNSYFDDVVVHDFSGANKPPIITELRSTPSSISDIESAQLYVSVNDVDNLPSDLTYSWTVTPNDGIFSDANAESPTFTVPDLSNSQTYQIKVTVSDGENSVSKVLPIVVTDANAANGLNEDFSSGDLSQWQVFNDGTLDAPSGWVVQNGVLVQKSNIYSLPTDAQSIGKPGSYLLYKLGGSWNDYDINFTMRTDDDDAMGVMFRYIDKDNYYRFSWDMSRTYRRLVKKKNGVFTVLHEDHVPYAKGRIYQGKIVALKDQLQVWIDGQQVLTAIDSDHSFGTIGFYTWGNVNSYFDDVVVNDLYGTNLPPVITDMKATPNSMLDTQTTQLSVSVTDVDNLPSDLSYSWSVTPSDGIFSNPNAESPVFSVPDLNIGKTYQVAVSVTDGNKVVSKTLPIVVGDANATIGLAEDFSSGDLSQWQVFNDGTLDAPSVWVMQNGSLIQKSNIYSLPTDTATADKLGTYLLYKNGTYWFDYDVRFDMRSDDDDTLGIMFRYVDKDNYYRFSWDMSRTYRRLVKKKNGVFTVLREDHIPYVKGKNYQVRVVALGSDLQIWLDGGQVFSVSDADLPHGTIGFYTWGNVNSYFDNLSVQ